MCTVLVSAFHPMRTVPGVSHCRSLRLAQSAILTALIFYSTFGFEHDAGYQLMLFIIPILGFPIVAILGLAAVLIR
jgi:hypothetical protein